MHLFAKIQEILFVQCFQCHCSFLFRCCFIPTLLFKILSVIVFFPLQSFCYWFSFDK